MKGLLILNLGTPSDPSPKEVGRYLREFLSDPFVVDIPQPFRWLLVNLLIVPRRAHISSELYKNIWSEKGSPLLYITRDLTEKVAQKLKQDYRVSFAMRYGSPNVMSSLQELLAGDLSELIIFPQYPQYAESSYESSRVEVMRCLQKLNCKLPTRFIEPFYGTSEFLDSCTEILKRDWNKQSHLIFSFHGLPERHLKKLNKQCLTKPDCCNISPPTNCYRAQCMLTAKSLAARLQIPPSQFSVGFQSRLGVTKWTTPTTESVLKRQITNGEGKVTLFAPSFTADCLETLEELGIRMKREFLKQGGKEFHLLPCLNAEETWVNNLCKLLA